ncbi:hypothetical protein PC123_g9116 [Phytophthora cactorum]|nr:hypothetical protein PC120_g9107 [Phytophthora cactorum]KAG4055801.1 hypothetical protein PC123_g9116 [Phytophthora cactorum]
MTELVGRGTQSLKRADSQRESRVHHRTVDRDNSPRLTLGNLAELHRPQPASRYPLSSQLERAPDAFQLRRDSRSPLQPTFHPPAFPIEQSRNVPE